MKRFVVLMLVVLLLGSCATVTDLQNGWDQMSPEQAAFEKTLLIVSGAAAVGFAGYMAHTVVTTEQMPEER